MTVATEKGQRNSTYEPYKSNSRPLI